MQRARASALRTTPRPGEHGGTSTRLESDLAAKSACAKKVLNISRPRALFFYSLFCVCAVRPRAHTNCRGVRTARIPAATLAATRVPPCAGPRARWRRHERTLAATRRGGASRYPRRPQPLPAARHRSWLSLHRAGSCACMPCTWRCLTRPSPLAHESASPGTPPSTNEPAAGRTGGITGGTLTLSFVGTAGALRGLRLRGQPRLALGTVP